MFATVMLGVAGVWNSIRAAAHCLKRIVIAGSDK
jgi:hypothetical protein